MGRSLGLRGYQDAAFRAVFLGHLGAAPELRDTLLVCFGPDNDGASARRLYMENTAAAQVFGCCMI
jgi:hypothetical protein